MMSPSFSFMSTFLCFGSTVLSRSATKASAFLVPTTRERNTFSNLVLRSKSDHIVNIEGNTKSAFIKAVSTALYQSKEKTLLSDLARHIGRKPPNGEKWKTFLEKRGNLFILKPVSSSDPRKGHYVSLRDSKKFSKATSKLPSTKSVSQSWKSGMFMLKGGVKCHVVVDESYLAKVISNDAVLQGKSNQQKQFVGFDSEGHGWRDFCLIQVATSKGVYLIDVAYIGSQPVFSKLRKFLTSKTIIKSIHDLESDAFHIQIHSKLLLSGVLDTQVAAEICLGEKRMGSAALVQKFSLYTPPGNQAIKKSMKSCRCIRGVPHFWIERPIPQEYLKYAAWDALIAFQVLDPLLENMSKSQLEDVIRRSNKKARDSAKTNGKKYDSHQRN